MTAIADLLAALAPIDGGWRGRIPEDWLQGRTCYGGLSSALALHAARASDTDLPPLRSAQVAFVGPLSGDVTVRARRLRRGRNAAFVEAEVESEAGLGLRATFVFMAAIESRLDHATGERPDFAPPGPDDATSFGLPQVTFTRRFEWFDAGARAAPGEWLRWVRLRDREGLDPMTELVAVADCLPPAALELLGGFAPVSSVTWLLNLLTAKPATRDGWWLLQARTDHARDGGSSQTMRIWNADGMAIAEQMQSVAIFA